MEDIKHIHGGNLRQAAENYGLTADVMIDFSANINPLGPSQQAVKAITENLSAITQYPDPEARELIHSVSEFLNLPTNMIFAGNGAVEIIYLLMKLLKPTLAMIPAPTFNEYEIAVRINGGKVKDLFLNEEKGFIIEPKNIYDHWSDCDVLFICNPNNPTGVLTPREILVDLIKEANKAGKTIVVDEAFMDFVADRDKYSVVDLVSQYDNLFVLYSLTKFFAIPGLRLGVGLGHRETISKMNSIRDPWNVNCFAQLAGVASLQDEAYIRSTIDYVSREKAYLTKKINAVNGFQAYNPAANYIFINVEQTGHDAPQICQLLGQQGVIVRDCWSYKNLRPVFIRVAVRTRIENDRLIEALAGLETNTYGRID